MAVEPDAAQLSEIAALAGSAGDGPVVMLNLNCYRDRDEYMRYGEVAAAVLDRVGGKVLWHTDAKLTVIVTDPGILAARDHRLEGLEHATLICCTAPDYAGVLSSELQR
jgi:hypothetical protein